MAFILYSSNGGFTIYDYETGSYADASPRTDGGFSVYDYNSGAYSEVNPRRDGGFDIYDYGIDLDEEDDADGGEEYESQDYWDWDDDG